jgi:hypothetical protein
MSGRLLQVTEPMLKALAREWFMRGFRCSGFRVHGETRVGQSLAFEGLLAAEFERAWGERKRPGQ